MESIAGHAKRFVRLLTEVSGTLTILAVVDTLYEGVNSEQYNERVKASTKVHHEQAKSMLVEYETLFRKLQTNMDHHLDLLTKDSKQRTRPWDTLISDLLPDAPSDDEQLLDVGIDDIFVRELETASFQERFRTVPRRDEGRFCRYRSGMSADAKGTKSTTSANKAAGDDVTEEEKAVPEKAPATTNKAPMFGYNIMQMFSNSASMHRVEGVQELLLVLDCLAEKQKKIDLLNKEFGNNFSLLMKDVDTKIQERMSPNEATNEEMIKSVIKVTSAALFFTLSRRVLFTGTGLDFNRIATAAAANTRKGLVALNAVLAMILIPAGIGLQSDLSNWLSKRPLTNWIVNWIKEDDEDLDEEESAEVNEEAERIVSLLLEEAPVLHRWKGTTPTDPFRVERMIIYDVIHPLTDLTVFYTLLWKSLLTFLPPVPSHLITMLSYAIYRDTIEDPHRAFLKLPSVESFVHSCLTSAFLQVQYLGSSILFPMATLIVGQLKATLVEMSASTAYHKESWQAYQNFVEVQAVKDMVAFKAFQSTLEKLRNDEMNRDHDKIEAKGLDSFTTVLTSILASKVSLPKYLDPQGKLIVDYKDLARKLVEVFSTDYFSDHSSRHMDKKDILDFVVAFEHYRKKCLQKLPEEGRFKSDTPLLGATDDSIQRFLIHPSTLEESALPSSSVTATKDAKNDHFLSKACYAMNEHNKLGEEITYMKDLEKHLEYMVSLDKIFPKGASIAEFEDFFAYALTKLPKESVEHLNLHDLRSSLAHWEEASVDEFLDLMQAFYTKLLESGQRNIALFEPELYSKFEQQLAGRRPVVSELNHLFAKFNFYLQIGSERITTHFLHEHGLTQHRLMQLIRKNSTQSAEVDQLKADWEGYFFSAKHRNKLLDAIPNIEKKRMLYELMFTRKLRQTNPLAMKKSTPEPEAEDNQGSEGSGDDGAAKK